MKLFRLVLVSIFVFLVSGTLSAQTITGCLGHKPKYIEDVFEVTYENGCTGHDEPELDPLSSLAGSAKDLTWTVVLPADGSHAVSELGPTFWFGGTVTDPKSLFGQAFVELQFYPDSIVTHCANTGAFTLQHAPNVYSVCSPVWKLTQKGAQGKFNETAAFNAMLTDSQDPSNPLLMHAGDTITVHWFVTPAADGYHVTVTDLASGHNGTIVLNAPSEGGPLMPAYDTQTLGGSLQWGGVFDTPNSFVWEIGHADVFGPTPAAFCTAGQTNCNSYDAASWAGTLPIQIKSVTFADGSQAKQWAAVSDLGGKAEVAQTCSTYGVPFCTYPWYTLGKTGFHYGIDFADTLKDFGQADQFATETKCGGPFGPNSTYCATILK